MQGVKPLPKLKKKTVYFLKVQPVKLENDNINKDVRHFYEYDHATLAGRAANNSRSCRSHMASSARSLWRLCRPSHKACSCRCSPTTATSRDGLRSWPRRSQRTCTALSPTVRDNISTAGFILLEAVLTAVGLPHTNRRTARPPLACLAWLLFSQSAQHISLMSSCIYDVKSLNCVMPSCSQRGDRRVQGPDSPAPPTVRASAWRPAPAG